MSKVVGESLTLDGCARTSARSTLLQMSPSRRPTRTAFAVDAALVLTLLVLSLWLGGHVIDAAYQSNPKIDHISPQARPLVAWAWVATGCQLATIMLCRRWPVAAWFTCSAMLIVHVVVIARLAALAPHPVGFAPLVPSDAGVLLALFTLTERRRVGIAVSCSIATLALAIYAANHSPLFGPRTIAALFVATLTVATFISGLAARSRAAYLAALLQRAVDLDRARIQEAELAVINERNRLALEIHDTVAHALGIIVVQAQGAAAAQARRPDLTRTALTAIIDVGRAALGEMRTLLTTEPLAGEAGRAPLRGIRDVPTLVQQLRETGTAVDLDMPAVTDLLPKALDHSLYRLVQESLTNAVKHTHVDRRIDVRIRAGDGHIVVRVHNSQALPAPHDPNGGSGGRGLIGMHERVAMLGGTIETGFDVDGGFTVDARLPIADRT